MMKNEVERACKNPALIPRPYQLEILEKALGGNTIACLGTGAGKTFIAILLIKELAHDVRGDFPNSAKRTIFLVPSVPLVYQQGQEIIRHTDLTVGMYSGSDVDNWTRQRWIDEFTKHQVLVMTAQILVNRLSHGDIELPQINLIVIDECHHATKSHPYVQIMQRFRDYPKKLCPRVLGLSASLLNKSSKNEDKMREELEELEKTMANSRVTTARNLKDIEQFAAKPEQVLESYAVGPGKHAYTEAHAIIDSLVDFLDATLERKKHAISKTKLEEKIKSLHRHVSTCGLVLTDLGPWAALTVAEDIVKGLEQSNRQFVHQDLTTLRALCASRLRLVAAFCKELSSVPRSMSNELCTTEKVHKLCELLLRQVQTGRPLCGLVFVERRYMAVGLAALLCEMGKRDPEFGSSVKCGYLTGHGSGSDNIGQSVSMAIKKQHKTLLKFREGELNVLVSTSVAEEGLDIRKCNLVIRFDELKEFRAYVQSAGRARDKPALFIVMTPDDDAHRETIAQRLDGFAAIEKFLIKRCTMEYPEDGEDEDVPGLDLYNTICPPYRPVAECSARADLGNASQIINNYCAQLCKETTLTPKYRFEEVESNSFNQQVCYRCLMQLPDLAPAPFDNEVIVGVPMPQRKMAKRAACLETVRRLHQAGELEDDLRNAVAYSNQRDEESEIMELPGGRKTLIHLGYSELYPITVPRCLQPQPNATGRPRCLYTFDIQPVNCDGKQYMQARFGLLMEYPLLDNSTFSVYPSRKELRVSVRLLSNCIRLDSVGLQAVNDYHHFLLWAIDVPRRKDIENPPLSFKVSQNDSLWAGSFVPLAANESIDFKQIDSFIDLCKGSVSPWRPFTESPSDKFIGRLLKRTYDMTSAFEVLSVSPELTARSEFPGVDDTYVDYFLRRYQVSVPKPDQPLFAVKSIGKVQWNFQTPTLVSDVASKESSDKEKDPEKLSTYSMHLPPSLCLVHVLSYNEFHAASLLPTILYHVFSCQLVAELSRHLKKSLPCSSDSDKYFSSFGSMKGHTLSTEAWTFPTKATLLKALTCKAAKCSYNLERLEMLGDSFLKFSTSVFLFCREDFAQFGEGRLTALRVKAISNLSLYHAARCCGLPGYIIRKRHDTKTNWLPPGVVIEEREGVGQCTGTEADDVDDKDEELLTGISLWEKFGSRALTHQTLKVKSIADAVEALIGAFLHAGGNNAARVFMMWLGLPRMMVSDEIRSNSRALCKENLPSLPGPVDKNSVDQDFLAPVIPRSPLRHTRWQCQMRNDSPEEMDHIEGSFVAQLSGLDEVERQLRYTFRDKSWMVEAFTHPTYGQRLRVGEKAVVKSYQRLEFLGDAIVDYLVVRHAFNRDGRKLSPGDLSDILHYVTSNRTLAKIATSLGWHKHLKAASPDLYYRIGIFARWVEETRPYNYHGPTGSVEGQGVIDVDDDDAPDAPKPLGDVVESMVAAIFLDCGMDLDRTWDVLKPFLQKEIDYALHVRPKSVVRVLHELRSDVKFEGKETPNGYSGSFVVGPVYVFQAHARNKEEAKSKAAKKALRYFQDLQALH